MSLCDKLNILVKDTVRILLFMQISDDMEFYYACKSLNMSVERGINTRCSNTADAISYLLGVNNGTQQSSRMTPTTDKLYRIELQGENRKRPTKLGHVFILLNNDNQWIILDAYINCREFTCTSVDLNYVIHTLRELEHKFDNQLWEGLTNEQGDDETKIVEINIIAYDYSTNNIKHKFNKLVREAQKMLKTEEGQSDEYVSLLSKEIDISHAQEYLESLLEI